MIDQLDGVSSLYLDSNILIYLVEDRSAKRDAVTAILAEAQTLGVFLTTSEITLAECLFGAFKQENEALAGVYRELFSGDGFIQTILCQSIIFEDAARRGATLSLKLVDAIHIASATHFGCDAFLTNDNGIRGPVTLKIIQLSDFL
jgi:predicted nucleic acid-binding protein